MVSSINFSDRIYCLITGASRGIGRQIAIELACRSKTRLTLVLLARSEAGLSETKVLIDQVNKNAKVLTYNVDLYKTVAEDFDKILDETFKKSEFDTAIIFHNAGHTGTINKASELSDKEAWKNYYELNFFSVTVLNSVFLKTVKNINQIFVINITSLIGRKAIKYFSMYGSAKAARDLYFKVVAEEEPKTIVLNYSPGMVQTALVDELVSDIKSFEDSEIAIAVKENSTFLTPEQTINKMFSVLEKAGYVSGDIIDYYDA